MYKGLMGKKHRKQTEAIKKTKVQYLFKIDEIDLLKLKIAAKKENLNVSEFIRTALAARLQNVIF